jgi:hypothetical protein
VHSFHSSYDYDEKIYSSIEVQSLSGLSGVHSFGTRHNAEVGFLRKLFGRSDEPAEDAPIALDVDTRLVQLERLERGLDALAREMRACHTIDDPGWRSRINEYGRLAGDAMTLRKGTPTREGVLDLVFEVRPVFTGPIPEGMTALGPLQDEVMAAADDLRELLPGESG